jgi:hypothetical protein
MVKTDRRKSDVPYVYSKSDGLSLEFDFEIISRSHSVLPKIRGVYLKQNIGFSLYTILLYSGT